MKKLLLALVTVALLAGVTAEGALYYSSNEGKGCCKKKCGEKKCCKKKKSCCKKACGKKSCCNKRVNDEE